MGDFGCGNGKYVDDVLRGCSASESTQGITPSASTGTGIHLVGSDRCVRLLDIAKRRHADADNEATKSAQSRQQRRRSAEYLGCDVVALPYVSAIFDFTMSIAVCRTTFFFCLVLSKFVMSMNLENESYRSSTIFRFSNID